MAPLTSSRGETDTDLNGRKIFVGIFYVAAGWGKAENFLELFFLSPRFFLELFCSLEIFSGGFSEESEFFWSFF